MPVIESTPSHADPSMPLLSTASPLPLFDRFSGAFAARGAGVRLTACEALLLSLHLDMVRLLSVRNGVSVAQFLDGAPDTLAYGLPDIRGLSPQSPSDLRCWERVIARAIAVHEPRLVEVRVKVTPDTVRPMVARVVILAVAVVDRELCRFHFDALADALTARRGAGADEAGCQA